MVRKIVLAGLVASLVPAVAYGREAAAPGGELILCSASGVRVATGTFTFTLVTVASAGGTTTLNVPVGTCTGRLFYPVGVSLTVSENVPAGFAVTGITVDSHPRRLGHDERHHVEYSHGRICRPHGRERAGHAHLYDERAGRRFAPLQGAERLRPRSHGREGRPPQGELHRRDRAQGQVHHLLPRDRLQPKPAAGHRSRASRAPSSSRSASAADHFRSSSDTRVRWLGGIRVSDLNRKAHTGFEPVPPP